MNCPICNVALQLSERQGIEIDYCPKCRGIWLDRGELDKIIERSEQQTPVRVPPAQVGNQYGYDHGDYKHLDHDYDHHHGHNKKKGFLHDLFD